MRISDWSSDVCSSDLPAVDPIRRRNDRDFFHGQQLRIAADINLYPLGAAGGIQQLQQVGFLLEQREHLAQAIHDRGDIGDRKRVVSGKSVSVRVGLGGRRIIKKKLTPEKTQTR